MYLRYWSSTMMSSWSWRFCSQLNSHVKAYCDDVVGVVDDVVDVDVEVIEEVEDVEDDVDEEAVEDDEEPPSRPPSCRFVMSRSYLDNCVVAVRTGTAVMIFTNRYNGTKSMIFLSISFLG